jgi:hypothetical protein
MILLNSHHFSIMAILEELNKLSRFNVFRFELQIFGKNVFLLESNALQLLS